MVQNIARILACGTWLRPKTSLKTEIKTYIADLANKTCGTMRFRKTWLALILRF